MVHHLDYVTGIPKVLPEGTVLVHNSVIPQRVLGRNGFRAWTQPLDDIPRIRSYVVEDLDSNQD